jgi:hypothetical protein
MTLRADPVEVIAADCRPTPPIEVNADRIPRPTLGAARAHVRERRHHYSDQSRVSNGRRIVPPY